jgi:hypothetical protein
VFVGSQAAAEAVPMWYRYLLLLVGSALAVLVGTLVANVVRGLWFPTGSADRLPLVPYGVLYLLLVAGGTFCSGLVLYTVLGTAGMW